MQAEDALVFGRDAISGYVAENAPLVGAQGRSLGHETVLCYAVWNEALINGAKDLSR